MASPLVSVVIPCFNAAPYVGLLLESVLGQTCADFEVLLADDGSRDDTAKVLEPFSKHPRVRLLRWDGNRGVSVATVTLLQQMRGQYWCYPGADDLLDPTFIESRLRRIETRPDAVWIAGPGHLIDGEGRAIPDRVLAPDLPAELSGRRLLEVLLQHNVINTPSVFVRSEPTLRVLPHFAIHWGYAQDWALWLLLAGTGGALLYDPQRLHSYRIHTQSLSHDTARAWLREAEIRLVPLCALAAAAKIFPVSAEVWERRGHALYCLWLRRALGLRRRGALRSDWMRWGREAWKGSCGNEEGIWREVVRHAPCMFLQTLKEQRARRRQSFPVSGLAQVDDPLFRA